MPRISERARLIKALSRYLRRLIQAENIESDADDDVDDVAEFLDEIESHRYLGRSREEGDKRRRNAPERFEQHLEAPEDDFRRSFRVSKAQFHTLVELLHSDAVFQPRRLGRPQSAVKYQLLLVLWRLAHSGTGATVFHIADRFGVSGTSSVMAAPRAGHRQLQILIISSLYPQRARSTLGQTACSAP